MSSPAITPERLHMKKQPSSPTFLFLGLLVLFALFLTMPISAEEPPVEAEITVDMTNPTEVANRILTAIYTEDGPLLISFFNKTNREKGISEEKLATLFQEWKVIIGDVKEVSEIKIRSSKKKTIVLGKIRAIDDEMFVVTLTYEDGKYYLEDINSPSVENYEKLEPYFNSNIQKPKNN